MDRQFAVSCCRRSAGTFSVPATSLSTTPRVALLASELLGHTDPRIRMQRYIQRNETVNPVTAEHLK
jgi:hypothetical protein